MDIRKKQFAALAVATLFTAMLPAAEYVKNGDFENGETAPWRISAPADSLTLSIVPDSVPPSGGIYALGVTSPGPCKASFSQPLNLGPGTYRVSAWIDTTRCTRPGGYVQIYLSGKADGKWRNFGSVHTQGTQPKVGWRKTEWTKFEKTVVVPPGGKIQVINVKIINITGMVMLDGISVQDSPAEETAETPAPPAR